MVRYRSSSSVTVAIGVGMFIISSDGRLSAYSFTVCAATVLFVLLTFSLYKAVPDETAHLEIDSYRYDAIAQTFARTGRLVEYADKPEAPVQPIGYPLLVGILYWMFGHRYAVIVFFQLLVALATLWLLGSIARRIFSKQCAQITVVLFAVNLGFLVYTQFILAEIVLVAFITLFIDRFLQAVATGSFATVVGAALIMSFSVFIKPVLLMYSPIAGLLLFFFTKGPVDRVQRAALFIVSFFIPVFLYMTYNRYMFGVFAFAPMTPLNLYHVLLSKVIARVDHKPIGEVSASILAFKGAHSFDFAGWESARQLFWDYLYRYPMVFAQVWVQNVIKTVAGLYTTQLKVLLEPLVHGGDCSFFALSGSLMQRLHQYIVCGTDSVVLWGIGYIEAGALIARYMLVLHAVRLLLLQRRFMELSFFSSLIAVCFLVTGTDGCCRYRLSCEPVLILMTAYALEYWLVIIKRVVKERYGR